MENLPHSTVKAMISIMVLFIAYLFGSIPWALIIGKIFYKKDIREYGSHNLGGSNTIRTLGLIPGICVIILDSSKALIFTYLLSLIEPSMIPFVGLFVCIGHCYPIFADFRGGKAVACALGYVLGINLFLENHILFGVIIPCIVFIIVLLISRYMSLSSMSALTCANIIGWFIYSNFEIPIAICLLDIFVIYRHKDNIKRIINRTENKIF